MTSSSTYNTMFRFDLCLTYLTQMIILFCANPFLCLLTLAHTRLRAHPLLHIPVFVPFLRPPVPFLHAPVPVLTRACSCSCARSFPFSRVPVPTPARVCSHSRVHLFSYPRPFSCTHSHCSRATQYRSQRVVYSVYLLQDNPIFFRVRYV